MPKFPPIHALLQKGGHGRSPGLTKEGGVLRDRIAYPYLEASKRAEILDIDACRELQNSAGNSKTFGVLHKKLRN